MPTALTRIALPCCSLTNQGDPWNFLAFFRSLQPSNFIEQVIILRQNRLFELHHSISFQSALLLSLSSRLAMSSLLPTWPRPTSHQLLGNFPEVLIKRSAASDVQSPGIQRRKMRKTSQGHHGSSWVIMRHHGSSWVITVEEAALRISKKTLRMDPSPSKGSMAATRVARSPFLSISKYKKIHENTMKILLF